MNVTVSEHARWRAAERFPRFDTTTIEEEVRLALSAGRVSVERGPAGGRPHSTCLYAWTADEERIYALRPLHRSFHVTTTLRRSDAPHDVRQAS